MKLILSALTLCGPMLMPVLVQQEMPAFETVTIKESQELSLGTRAPDRFSRPHTTLSLLLVYAYQVSEFQVEGGSEWVRTKYFSVEAKAEQAPTAEQMRQMVRRLLAERFALRLHSEVRDRPRYALVMARDDRRLGPRLRPSAFDCPAIVAARGPDYRPSTSPPQPGDPPSCALRFRVGNGGQTMLMEGQPMSAIARLLQPQAGRIVVDKTGLTGTYDFELETEPQSVPGIPANVFGAPRDGLSLFTALPEQLELKLESERGSVDVLVIDGVNLPTPN